MKPLKMNKLTKNLLLGSFATLIIITFNSCTKKIDFEPSTTTLQQKVMCRLKRTKTTIMILRSGYRTWLQLKACNNLKVLMWYGWKPTSRQQKIWGR